MKLLKTVFDTENTPRNFSLKIIDNQYKLLSGNISFNPTIENMKELLETCTINKGNISNSLIFIENEIGLLELVATNSKKYTKALNENKLTLRDINVGDKVNLLNKDEEYIYLGSVYKYYIYSRNNNMYIENIKLFLDLSINKVVEYSKTPSIMTQKENVNIYSSVKENINKLISGDLVGRYNNYTRAFSKKENLLKELNNNVNFINLITTEKNLTIKDLL